MNFRFCYRIEPVQENVSIISAVLTPTPDIFNMSLMGVPLYLLYEIGLIGMRIWGSRKSRLSSNQRLRGLAPKG